MNTNVQLDFDALIAANDVRQQLQRLEQWEADCSHLHTAASFHTWAVADRYRKSNT